MLSSVLKSERAIHVNIQIMRVFTRQLPPEIPVEKLKTNHLSIPRKKETSIQRL